MIPAPATISLQCLQFFTPVPVHAQSVQYSEYDEVPDLGYNSVAQRPDFKSALRVIKNGSEHPMLSISMAYNVISCKQVKRLDLRTTVLISGRQRKF